MIGQISGGEVEISYRYTLDTGQTETFLFRFNADTLEADWPLPSVLPDWALLTFQQCSHCPFTPEDTLFCPLAARLVDVISRLGHLISYDALLVEVDAPERSICLRTSAQRGVSSVLGLIIPTSGCPYTAFFRPMARFHLPFSTQDETFYRAASMYMLAQYFLNEKAETVDLHMDGLTQIYRDMEVVNLKLVERLKAATKGDSTVNAVIILDLFAKSMPFVLEDRLEEFRYLFEPFLDAKV